MRKHLPGLGLALASALLCYSLADRGLMMPDEGNLLMAASRIVDGQVPYRDYYHFYGPARFYLLAGLFELFGRSFMLMRILLATARVVVVTLTYLLAARFMPRRYALVAALMVLLVPGPWFKSFYQLAGLAPMLAVLRFTRRPGWRWAACCGLCSGVALLFRQDAGLLTLLVGLFAAAAAPFRQRVVAADRARFALCMVAAAALPIGVAAALLARAGALGPAIEQMFLLAPSYTTGQWDSIGQVLDKDESLVEASPFLMPIAVTLVAAVVWARDLRRDRRSLATFELLLLVGMGAVSAVPAFLPAHLIRLYQSWHFAWIVAAYLFFRAAAWARDRHGPRLGWLVVALCLLLPLTLSTIAMTRSGRGLEATEYSGTPVHLAKSTTPLVVRGETLLVTPFKAQWISEVVDHVKTETQEGEPILVIPNQSMLYYFCDRPNPTSFIATYTLCYPSEVQDRRRWQQLVDEVDRSEVRLAIVRNKFMASDNEHYMRRYLLENFQKTARFGSAQVWMRKGRSQPR